MILVFPVLFPLILQFLFHTGDQRFRRGYPAGPLSCREAGFGHLRLGLFYIAPPFLVIGGDLFHFSADTLDLSLCRLALIKHAFDHAVCFIQLPFYGLVLQLILVQLTVTLFQRMIQRRDFLLQRRHGQSILTAVVSSSLQRLIQLTYGRLADALLLL